MSIYYYERNQHPGGFIGYRVAVMVAGKFKQKYLGTKDGDWLEQSLLAYELNAKWEKEKEIAKSAFNNRAEQTSRSKTPTGVRGISKCWIYSPDKKGNKRAYKHYRYKVQGRHEGNDFSRQFPVTQKGWVDAVTYYAKKKYLTRWRHLLKRQVFNEV